MIFSVINWHLSLKQYYNVDALNDESAYTQFVDQHSNIEERLIVSMREMIITANKTIMLACLAGMSTSLLVSKIQSAAKEKGKDYKIFATATSGI